MRLINSPDSYRAGAKGETGRGIDGKTKYIEFEVWKFDNRSLETRVGSSCVHRSVAFDLEKQSEVASIKWILRVTVSTFISGTSLARKMQEWKHK